VQVFAQNHRERIVSGLGECYSGSRWAAVHWLCEQWVPTSCVGIRCRRSAMSQASSGAASLRTNQRELLYASGCEKAASETDDLHYVYRWKNSCIHALHVAMERMVAKDAVNREK
jgi:hypothetical protein